MIDNFKDLAESAKARCTKAKLVLCCAEDIHALQAVSIAQKSGLIHAILIGNQEKICALLHTMGESTADYEIVHRTEVGQTVACAAELVCTGSANIIMKGNMQTAELMSNVLKKENHLRDSDVLSVCGNYVMDPWPNGFGPKILSVTDPALNVHPNLNQKKAILQNAVRLRHALGEENPSVAVIAANEKVSPKIQETVDADILKQMSRRGEITGCVVEGPISLDLAINPEAVAIKGYQSPVAGNADLLLMPDLVSANVLAKGITDIAGGETAGLVLGAKVPIVLVSRASTASDKYNSIALAAYVAEDY